MAEIGETFLAPTREVWRTWLAEHHATSAEIWLVFGKKGSGVQTVSLEEAVEEAVCFGWIDSRLKRIDDRTHALRFSPRKPKSVWSQSNKDRVERLIAQGRMTPAGLAAVVAAKASGRWDAADPARGARGAARGTRGGARRPAGRPGGIRPAAGLAQEAAHRLGREAKRDETRRRRIDEVVRRAEAGGAGR